MTRDFEGKVAIVTGAAGALGGAVTGQLVERGASVVAVDVEPVTERGTVAAIAAVNPSGSSELWRRRCRNGVSIAPGATALTRMSGASSTASWRVSWTIAPLLAE